MLPARSDLSAACALRPANTGSTVRHSGGQPLPVWPIRPNGQIMNH